MPGRGECQMEHRHVQQINRDHCHDGYRYWQEFVPRRWPRPTRRDRTAAEVVTRLAATRKLAALFAPCRLRSGRRGREGKPPLRCLSAQPGTPVTYER